MKTPVFTPVIASASEAIHSPKERMDCFVACAPRNDGEGNHCGGGECDGSGGGVGSGRRGSRQAPALRPAIIQ
jgi:hypothetical protein